MNSSTNNFRSRMILSNLTQKDLTTLKDKVARKLQLSLDEKEKILIESDIQYVLKYFIQYLNHSARFLVLNNVMIYSNIIESFIKFIKFTINTKLIKIFCELIKNSICNKKWTKRKKFRVVTSKSIYLLLLNKKSKRNIDYAAMNISEINFTLFSYHYIISQDSRIFEKHIWFVDQMKNSKNRMRIAIIMTQSHLYWKFKTHRWYKDQCFRYVKKRIIWETLLIKKTLKLFDIIWSTFISASDILDFLKQMIISENCRSLVKQENMNE
jgi:hypothetical protein